MLDSKLYSKYLDSNFSLLDKQFQGISDNLMNFDLQKEIAEYSDEALFEKIALKEKWAFSEIYDRYSARLYGLALKILKDQTLAEDTLQEVFLTIWNKAGRYRSERGAPLGWMTILCRNRCIDALRKQEKERQRSSVLNEDVHQISEADDPLHKTDYREMQSIIKDSFENLSTEQRVPIEMAYFQGLSQSEIAADLNLPLGTVKTRMRLGMQKLRNVLLAFQP